MSVSGFYFGFCLGKYASVNTMPDKVATEFLRQFRVYLWQKEGTGLKYRGRGAQHNSIGMGDLDHELDYPEFKDCDDSKGDDFIRSIIDQRNDLINQYDISLARVEEEENRIAKYKKDTIRDNCLWAMERSRIREEENEREEFLKRNRRDAANAMIQADLVIAKKAAKEKAKNKEWEKMCKKILARNKKKSEK